MAKSAGPKKEMICVSQSLLLTIIKSTLEIPVVDGVPNVNAQHAVQPAAAEILPPKAPASPAK